MVKRFSINNGDNNNGANNGRNNNAVRSAHRLNNSSTESLNMFYTVFRQSPNNRDNNHSRCEMHGGNT